MLYIAVMLFGGFLYSWAKLPKNSVKDHKIPTVVRIYESRVTVVRF